MREGFGIGVGELLGFGEFDVVVGGLLEDEAALEGVGDERDVWLGGSACGYVEVQHHGVGEAGGEDERSAFDGKGDGGLEEAGDLIGVRRAKRGSNGWLDGG